MASYKMVDADQLDTDLKSVADKIREKSELSNQLVWPSGYIDGIDQLSSLNFSVVGGTTQPSNPKENTIWVNTDVKITGWLFDVTEPENPTEGMLWIATGITSPVTLNVLKKDGITIHPLFAKQYISGALVDKPARIYQNGNWKDWVLFLVKDGIAVEGTAATVLHKTHDLNYADFSSSPPSIHVHGNSITNFRIDSIINAGGFSKVEISGETQMAAEAPATSTYATITADIADKTGTTIYASGSFHPTVKGSFQPFDIVIDLKSVSAAETYLFFTFSKDGNYYNYTHIDNITFS